MLYQHISTYFRIAHICDFIRPLFYNVGHGSNIISIIYCSSKPKTIVPRGKLGPMNKLHIKDPQYVSGFSWETITT